MSPSFDLGRSSVSEPQASGATTGPVFLGEDRPGTLVLALVNGDRLVSAPSSDEWAAREHAECERMDWEYEEALDES